ncbi:MAG: hypothetical protein K1X82_13410, partial [Bacteroidia bacterium]|nr:hypothetical protein [Bacteroidia bacterium]
MENSCFKIGLVFLGFLVGVSQPRAQNLVPNPSFEEYSDCPTTEGQLENATGWVNPNPASQATPDYYNSCNCQNTNVFNLCVPHSTIGYQQAHSGVAYAGVFTFSYLVSNAREYLQIKLSDTLVQRRKYLVGFYCSLRDDLCNLATNNWGAFLSRDAISKNIFLIDTIPQLVNGSGIPLTSKTEWMLVSDTIEAEGGEAYITIGNFFQDSLTDTVSVYLEINGQPSTYWGYK